MSATKEKLHNQIESEMRKSQTVNYIKKSAVDWLKPKIELMLMDGYKLYPNELEEAFEIAKDLENKKQGYSDEDMIEASKYGYNFHKTTQFPNQEFEDSCIRNTQQWIVNLKTNKI